LKNAKYPTIIWSFKKLDTYRVKSFSFQEVHKYIPS
jgi:hypothetical protein